MKNKYLFTTVALLLLINIVMWINFPIYPDEVNWRVTVARYFLDGGEYYHFMRGCYSKAIEIPWNFKIQMIILSAYSLFNSHIFFRLIPLLGSLFLIYTLFINIKTNKNTDISILSAITVTIFVMFGTSGSVWNYVLRAEHLILVFMGICLLFNRVKNKSNIFILLIFSLWSIICIAHPKSIYLLIVMIAIIFESINTRRIKILWSFTVLLYAILVARYDYTIWINCSSLEEFQTWLLSMNSNPTDLITNPKIFIENYFKTIGSHLNNIITKAPENISFTVNYTLNVLPPVKVSFYVSLMNIIIKNIFIINISIGIILLINNIKSIYNKKSSNYILTSCYIFIYLLIILNRTINNYDVQFWTTWILILNIYTISLKQDLFSRIFSKKILVIFLILFLISNFIDYRYYYRVFKNEWTQGVLVGPNTPLKYFNSAVQVELKNDFEQNCIDSNENEIILYDDITYIALQGYSKKVSPLTYTEYPFYQNQTLEIGKERFSKFIENYKKPVIYAACAYNGSLPDKFKITHTNRKYKICCYKYKIQ